MTITSRNVFLTFSTDISLENTHGSGNANSGPQYFFMFMGSHPSDEVLDNYVNTLDGFQTESLQKAHRLIIH